MINKYWEHFKTISKHKIIVSILCFKCGIISNGLLHDLSKYSPIEFLSSVKYWTGTCSPINNEKKDKGYSLAWQHHKGRNPHHWEYWIDNLGTYQNTPCKIPYNYVVEMICDWIGAGIVYSKKEVNFNSPYIEPKLYYNKMLKERIFHPDTKKLIEYFLTLIEIYGINSFCRKSKSKRILQKYNEN